MRDHHTAYYAVVKEKCDFPRHKKQIPTCSFSRKVVLLVSKTLFASSPSLFKEDRSVPRVLDYVIDAVEDGWRFAWAILVQPKIFIKTFR